METLNSEGIEVIFVPLHKKSSRTDQYIKILKEKTGACLYLVRGYMMEKSFVYVQHSDQHQRLRELFTNLQRSHHRHQRTTVQNFRAK